MNVYKRKGETNTEGWTQLLSKTLNSSLIYILAMLLSRVWIKAKQLAGRPFFTIKSLLSF